MCTPLTANLAIITPENDKQITFGLTKTCNSDGSSSWEINFTFKEKQADGTWLALITLDLNVNPQAPKAQQTAQNGLSSNQLLFLQGPVYSKAKQVASTPPPAPVNNLLAGLKADNIMALKSADLQPLFDHAVTTTSNQTQLNALLVTTLSVS